MFNITKDEKELIKKLTFLHLKRCKNNHQKKLDLTLSLKFLEAYSPLIMKDYFDDIVLFLSKNQNIVSLIDKKCHSSSLYQQPVIYLLYYLRFNYGKDFNKYWNHTDIELTNITNDIKKLQII